MPLSCFSSFQSCEQNRKRNQRALTGKEIVESSFSTVRSYLLQPPVFLQREYKYSIVASLWKFASTRKPLSKKPCHPFLSWKKSGKCMSLPASSFLHRYWISLAVVATVRIRQNRQAREIESGQTSCLCKCRSCAKMAKEYDLRQRGLKRELMMRVASRLRRYGSNSYFLC